MNQSRGKHREINDMWHLTLESIKKYYAKESEEYPLKEAIERYAYFFYRFASFNEYTEYDLLQDHELLP